MYFTRWGHLVRLLACILLVGTTWFGSGDPNREIDPLAECMDMCYVIYVEANVLFGAYPDYAKCIICTDNCRRKLNDKQKRVND